MLVVNQPADDDTLQRVFDVSDTEVDAPAVAGDHDDKPRLNVGLLPACDTVIVLVCVGLPLVVMNVSVAERAPTAVFAAAVRVTVWLPFPEFVLVVNQVADEGTLQVVFEVTEVDVDAPAVAGDHDDKPRLNAGLVPACDTVIVLVCVGVPEVVVKVSVAERVDVAVFAAAVRVTVWLPFPEFVLVVNQVADEDTLQVVFDVTEVDVDAPAATGDQVDKPRLNVGVTVAAAPACDTVIVLVCVGLPVVVVNVSVAERADVAVFAAAVRAMSRFPVPDFVVVVNQSAEDDTLQFVFEVTDAEVDEPVAAGDHEDKFRFNVGAIPSCHTVNVLVCVGLPVVVVNVNFAERVEVIVFAAVVRVTF